MTIQGLGSPFIQGISGVSGTARTEEERRQSRKTSEETAALDPRAAFDADVDALLGDVSNARKPNAPAQSAPDSRSNRDRFSHNGSQQSDDPGTYNASGRLQATPAPVLTTGPVGASLASEPAVVPAGADASSGKEQDKSGAKAEGELSPEEQKQVEKLRQRDQEVRAHEQAHQATGGEHAGGASYTYQRGPDNRQYAIGGSVPIDVSPVADDPEATVAKAEKVRAAAMAPASPSGADQQVAAKASQMAAKARAEQSEKALNPEKDDDKLGMSGLSEKSEKSEKAGKSEKSESTDRTALSPLPDLSDKSNLSGTSATSDQSGIAAASSIHKAEKAAESGLIAQAPQAASATSNTPSDKVAKTEGAGTSAEAGLAGLAGNARVSAASPLQLAPRPAESTVETPESRNDTRSEMASPSAQSTRAAFASLQQLGQAASETAGRDQSSQSNQSNQASQSPEAARRMTKATAAYARVRGETGLAPANTGISMAV